MTFKSEDKEFKDYDKKLKSIIKEIDVSEKHHTGIKADIYSSERQCSKLKKVIIELKRDESSRSKNVKKLESVKDELEIKIAQFEIRKQRAEKLTHAISNLEVRKNVAQSDLDKLFKSQSIADDKIKNLQESFDNKREDLEKKHSSLVEKYESFSGKVGMLEDEIKDIENKRDDKLNQLEDDIGHKNAELEAVNSLINKAEDEYIAWQNKIKNAEKDVDIENRKVQTVKDAYEKWRVNRLEAEAKVKINNKIESMDNVVLSEILNNV